MMFALYNAEIKIIKIIQLIKSDWVTQFFLTMNIFDGNYAYLVVAIILWNVFEAQKGLEFLYLQVVGATFCYTLKVFFALPRPYELDASLKILGTSLSYGFPSGAATASTICFGYIFLILKPQQKLLRSLALLMIFLVGMTRIYLGAHFITDVIGGYLLGAFILTVYFYGKKYVWPLLSKQSIVIQLIIHTLFLSLLFIFCGSTYLIPLYGVLLSALFVYYVFL